MRHPAVTACAIASVDAVSGGRAFLGFASGGGGMIPLGFTMANNDRIRAAIVGIREQLDGQPSGWSEGRPLGCLPAHRVPILLAAYGLSRARLAGEVADGLVWAGGVSEDILALALAAVVEGAESVGRDPAEIEICALVRGAVGETQADAVAGMKANLATAGRRGLGARGILETVPLELRDSVRELERRYVEAEHVRWDGDNAHLIDTLGLTDFLADRFAIAGPPDVVGRRVAELESRGVSQVLVPAVDKDPTAFLRAWAGAVGLRGSA